MPNTRHIRRRIQSIRNTAQITRAMQTVAASRMRRAQEAALNGRPFAEMAMRLMATASQKVTDFEHPLLETRSIRNRCVVVLSTDKGLCGALNANVFRELTKFNDQSTQFVAVGKKAAQFLARTRRNLLAEFTFQERPVFSDAYHVARFVMNLFIERKTDEALVLYPRFINTLRQEPNTLTLLPMSRLWEEVQQQEPLSEFLFEPNVEAVMDYLLRYFVAFEILQLMHETRASEHSARMVAMKNATDNANELIQELTLTYNKIRQASITTELLDNVTAQMAMQ